MKATQDKRDFMDMVIERIVREWLALAAAYRVEYVPTCDLAPRVGYSERQMRAWLGRLEAVGVMERRGKRGGWRVAA